MRRIACFFLIFIAVLLLAASPRSRQAVALDATPTPAGALPEMPPIPTLNRLAPPPTVYPPTQAGDGAQVYYQVCMTCHGDRGQGLTEEWRMSLDPEDQNCWQSGCHHTRRPPQGFIFPREVPRVVGGGALVRFSTALDLHEFLVEKMPYQKPGSLTEAEYWQLTAFLLEKNGIAPPAVLDAAAAAALPLRAAPPAARPSIPASLIAAGVLVLLAILAGAAFAFRALRKNR